MIGLLFPGGFRAVAAACLMLCIISAGLAACSGDETGMQNGYYSAELAQYDADGWKEFITIYVMDNRIVTVDYDAKNQSGFLKSWDIDCMRAMNEADGTYPKEYARLYSNGLLNRQDPELVDAVTGATNSYNAFGPLAKAAIEHARNGDTSVAFVQIPVYD